MDSEVAPVAEDDRVRVLALAIVTDRALGVFDGHVALRLWNAFDLASVSMVA